MTSTRPATRPTTRPTTRPAKAARSGLGVAAVLAFALMLAACGGDEGSRLPCPRLFTADDAVRQVKFVGVGRDLTDVEFEAAIDSPVLACRYHDGAVESRLTLNLVAARGPADVDRQARVTYFVAVLTREHRELTSEQFSVDFEFEGNRTRITAIEEIEPRIPLAAGQTGADYEIVVGLRLTPEELRYNRENR